MRLFFNLVGWIILINPWVNLANGATLQSKTWSLDEVVSQALEKSPSVYAAQQKLDEVRSQRTSAVLILAPNISGSLGAYYKKDASSSSGALFGGEPYNAYSMGLQVTQPIFAGESLWRKYMAARDEVRIQETNLQIAERNLRMEAVRQFFGLLLAQAKVDQLKKTQAIYDELESFAQKRIRLKLGQDLELLQIQTRKALLVPRVERTQAELTLAATNLATLMRVEQGGEIRIRGGLDSPNWDDLIATEKKRDSSKPEILRAAHQVSQYENLRAVEMAVHWPQLSATADWGRTALRMVDLADHSTTAWSIGIQLKVPLFSGLSSFSDRAALSSRIAQIEAQQTQVLDQVYMERQRAERELDLSRLVVDSSRVALKLAQRSFNFAQDQHRVGRIEFTRLSDVQESLLEAELSYDQARHDRILAIGNYLVSRGGDIQAFVTALEIQ